MVINRKIDACGWGNQLSVDAGNNGNDGDKKAFRT
jgi:hypothetical protein